MSKRSLKAYFARIQNLPFFSRGRPNVQEPSRTIGYAQLEDRILFSASPVDIELLDAPIDALETDIAWDLPDVDASYGFTPDTLGFDELIDIPLLEVAADPVATSEHSVELLVVDANVDNWEELVHDALTAGTQFALLMLDADADGIEQISEALQQLDDVSAIHLVSHGTEGQIQLGKTTLRIDNLQAYAGQLTSWADALSQDADLLIYGCKLAGDVDGRALVEKMSALTGADVAASVDNTGHVRYGGDWDLEYTTGTIETEITVSEDGQQAWFGLLATLTVDTTADVLNGDADTSSVAALIATPGADGLISLREAIIATNNSPGADTIALPSGTYTLSIAGTSEDAAATGDLDITDNLTINGAGVATTIIDGGAIDRVFDARGGGNADLSGLTIQNGDAGGGAGGGVRVSSGGNFTLTDVVIRGSSGADGAGIHNSGTLKLTDVEIIGNTTSGWGGGLYNNAANATLESVTFSGNSAGKDGGGIYNFGVGASLSLTNVTLSGNTAISDGGGLYTSRDVDVTNSTIALNTAASGGGIHAQGSSDAFLTNTILYNNAGGNANKALGSLGYNIDSGNTASLTGPGDQINTDPLLGALQDNGGPTQTHALLVGSPAIDTGTSVGAPTTDQRGVLRDASPDIGAFEATSVGAISDTNASADIVAENAGIGAAVGITALATDPDAADNVTYSLDADASGLFTINGTTGVVTVNGVLDAETSTSHAITVRATSDDTSFSTQNFTITVTDVNESPIGAISDTDGGADTVAEDAAIGDTVGVMAFTDDPDVADNVTYSLDVDAGGLFTINGTTGVVTVNGALDAETSTSHTITVRATSDDTSFSTQNFTITVTDVNEFPVGPVADTDVAVNEVNESTPNGSVVGITAFASDGDVSDNISYSLDDDASGRFSIDASSGVITVADTSLLDFEAWTSHNVTVRATSDDLSFTTQVFTINILDDPTETGVGAISDTDGTANAVNENAAAGTAVGLTAFAIDADAIDNVSYSLDDDDGGRFQIDGVSGVVTVLDAALLDYELATSHTVVVRATSTDTSFSTRSFTISLIDQNDNAPVVTAGQSFNVGEDAANGTVLGTTLATDVDTVGAPTGWAITGGNTDGIFAVNPLTGDLSVVDNTLLDFETTSSYTLDVIVSDGVIFSAVEMVVVNVTNVNETPTLAGPVTTTLTENDPVQSVNLLAGATDPDGDTLNVSGLTLVAGDASGITVSGNTLQLNPSAYNRLAQGASEVISYTYDVNDSGGGVTPQTATITVTGLNDAPVAMNDSYASITDVPLVIPAGGVLSNDADAEGDPLTVAVLTNPSNGTVTVNADGSFTYTPNAGFVGTDTFFYAASDILGASDTATVTINVGPVAAPSPSSGGSDPPPIENNGDDSEDEDADLRSALQPHVFDQEENESTPRRRRQSTASLDGVMTVAPIVTIDAMDAQIDDARINAEIHSRSTIRGIEELAHASVLGTSDLDFNTVSTALYEGLSKLEDDLMSAVHAQTWSVGYALGMTTGLSVGYVLWILRSGYLVTSVLSTMAPWMMVDPMLVLDHLGKDNTHIGVDKDDALESMMDQSAGAK